jgi:hypothetical protein
MQEMAAICAPAVAVGLLAERALILRRGEADGGER